MKRRPSAVAVVAFAILCALGASAQEAPDLAGEVTGLQARIVQARAQNQALQDAAQRLHAEIARLQQKAPAHHQVFNLVAVKHSNTAVMRKPQESAPLFRAVADDEFEILAFRNDWVQVRLGEDASGWLRRSEVTLLADGLPSAPPHAPAAEPDFAVAREAVNVFLGDWAGLKGRRALFLFALPLSISPDASSREKKLEYVKELFADRYRMAIHSGRNFQGVVVIFQGGGGGAAAATTTDIRRWVEGEIPEKVFLSRCSLDLPAGIAR